MCRTAAEWVASRSLSLRVRRIPHLTYRMRLRHQPLEVVHEPFAAVFRILIMPADVDRFLRANLLTIAAENAPKLVDLEQQGIAIALLVFARYELDAVRWTHRWTETAGDALRLAVLRREHTVRSAPTWRERPLLLGVLNRHCIPGEKMSQRQRHTAQRRAYITRLLDRTLEHLHTNCHQSPASAGVKRVRSSAA